MSVYTLYWPNGVLELVYGESLEQALREGRYSKDVLKRISFYTVGDDTLDCPYTYDPQQRKWIRIGDQDAPLCS